MAATYDVHGHPLLSTEAAALADSDAEAFDAQVRAAERTLGLRGTQLAGHDREDAEVAVVRQLNLQLRIAASGDVVSESKGSQSFTYAQKNGERVAIDRVAWTLARQLVGRMGAPPSSSTEIAATW